MTVALRTLGPVEITVNGGAAPAELLWRKNLALLVYLARSPQRGRSRDHLIGLLWGDKPEAAARHSLNEALRVLRHALGEDGIDTAQGRVQVAPDRLTLDTDRFDALAQAADWPAAAALVSGEFMEGFAVPDASDLESWLTSERDTWRRRGSAALLHWADAALARGDAAAAAVTAARAMALAPTTDNVIRLLVRALALTGDRAAALEQYESFRERLAATVGIEPEPETRALIERVRREPLRPESAAAPRVGAESRRAPLVGREAELDALWAAVTRSRTSRRAGFALVEGDAGAGRTRLSQEVMARARLDGVAVVMARAVAADATTPWAGVWGLARGGLLAAPGIAAAPAEAWSVFAARVPEWADRFGAPGATAHTPAGALSECLRAVAEEGPVLLVVDDAHWLDAESLRGADALLRDLESLPVCVLLTATTPVPAGLDALRSRVPGVSVRLGALSPDAHRALARWALPRYDDDAIDRVARRVATDSAGLPLLAVELFHAIALGLELRGTPSAWPEESRTLDHTMPGQLPEGVVAAVRVGVRRLSTDAQRVLAAAAVLGDRQPPDVLGRATGLHGPALAAALDELEWERWLTAEARGYDFVARIVREIVARDFVTEGQRRRIVEAAS